jgi:catechol 2,3-dioxygenase
MRSTALRHRTETRVEASVGHGPAGSRARCIDHVTITTADPSADGPWYRDTLGHRYTEYTVIPERPDFVVFAMTTTCELAHNLGLVWDPTPARRRINHMACFVEYREELLRAADVLLNQDVAIEFGPGKHRIGEQNYLYAREPSGMRFELNAGGWRNYEPDLETVRYKPRGGRPGVRTPARAPSP